MRTAIAFNDMPWPDDTDEVWNARFDNVAINLLRRAVSDTKAVCVLSSTWRLDGEETRERLSNFLEIPIIDSTKSFFDVRGVEIKEWLDRHPEVTKYAIIDDDSDMLEEQMPYLTKTTFENGMLYNNYQDIIKILSDET